MKFLVNNTLVAILPEISGGTEYDNNDLIGVYELDPTLVAEYNRHRASADMIWDSIAKQLENQGWKDSNYTYLQSGGSDET